MKAHPKTSLSLQEQKILEDKIKKAYRFYKIEEWLAAAHNPIFIYFFVAMGTLAQLYVSFNFGLALGMVIVFIQALLVAIFFTAGERKQSMETVFYIKTLPKSAQDNMEKHTGILL